MKEIDRSRKPLKKSFGRDHYDIRENYWTKHREQVRNKNDES
jgi:hypothetical protein